MYRTTEIGAPQQYTSSSMENTLAQMSPEKEELSLAVQPYGAHLGTPLINAHPFRLSHSYPP